MKIVADDEFIDCATALARASARALRAFTRSDLSSEPDAFPTAPFQVALIVAYCDDQFSPSLSQFSRRTRAREYYLRRSDRRNGKIVKHRRYKTTLRRLVTRNDRSRIVNVYNVFNGLQ